MPKTCHSCFAQQAEDKEEDEKVTIKVEEDELMKAFQTAVSACVHSSLMTEEKAQTYCRSGEIHTTLRVC